MLAGSWRAVPACLGHAACLVFPGNRSVALCPGFQAPQGAPLVFAHPWRLRIQCMPRRPCMMHIFGSTLDAGSCSDVGKQARVTVSMACPAGCECL